MKAFLVAVNGKRVCLAGIGESGVLGVSTDWVGGKALEGGTLAERMKLTVGGLDTTTAEHVHWDTRDLSVGDEICIKIVETESVDPESRRYGATNRHD